MNEHLVADAHLRRPCRWCRRIMSPEPAMTNFTLSITSSTFLAAARKYSGALLHRDAAEEQDDFSSAFGDSNSDRRRAVDIDAVMTPRPVSRLARRSAAATVIAVRRETQIS